MLLYRIDCDECGAPRVGRKRNDIVRPFRKECPLCGSTDYVVPADEDDPVDRDEPADENESVDEDE